MVTDACVMSCVGVCFFRRSLWLKACSYTLNPSQSEVKVDFPLPITARNVIIEFADFYENVQVRRACVQLRQWMLCLSTERCTLLHFLLF